jgi:hypothetical protein
MALSAAYHLHHSFVARDLIVPGPRVDNGPIVFRPGTGHFFVLCEVQAATGTWFDGLPVSPETLSDWTRILTTRMGPHSGLLSRGYKAHRYAAATNTTTCALLENNGMEVSLGRIDGICR